MMTLITGTPGSGKTLFAVSKIIEESKKGRTVYSDIDGLTVPGVLPIPEDLDWSQTPDGSLIVYDEAQQHKIFENTGRAVSSSEIVKKMQVHRHTGHDLWFITQSPRLIHGGIKALIGEHFNLHRPYGAAVASVYMWRVCEENPNTESVRKRAENQFMFNFPKDIFQYYKSATVHTHKFKLPRKVVIPIVIMFLLIGAGYYLYNKTALFHNKKKTADTETATANANKAQSKNSGVNANTQTATPIPNVAAAPAAAIDLELKRVAMVIQTNNLCIAKNSYGEPLPIDYKTCFLYANNSSMFSTPRVPHSSTYDHFGTANTYANNSPVSASSPAPISAPTPSPVSVSSAPIANMAPVPSSKL